MFKNKFFNFSHHVIVQFSKDGCFTRAASLAYTTLLSLVPLLTVSFSVLSSFPMFKNLAQQMQNFVLENFVAASAQTVEAHLQAFVAQTAKLPVLGLLLLVATAVFLVFSIELAFNAVWHVKKRRDDVSAFLIYWGVITFVPILVAIGLTMIAYIAALPIFTTSTHMTFLSELLTFIVPYLLTYMAFALLYIALPNCKVPLKSAVIAALPTTILFELAKQAFALYIEHFPTYKLIYGALAVVPIFLVWLYISWVIILFGAVISRALTPHEE